MKCQLRGEKPKLYCELTQSDKLGYKRNANWLVKLSVDDFETKERQITRISTKEKNVMKLKRYKRGFKTFDFLKMCLSCSHHGLCSLPKRCIITGERIVQINVNTKEIKVSSYRLKYVYCRNEVNKYAVRIYFVQKQNMSREHGER